jgi:hypothetical protein
LPRCGYGRRRIAIRRKPTRTGIRDSRPPAWKTPAHPAFDAFFRIVAAARRPLDVRCVRCAHLGEDEAWFLQLIGLLQRNRTREAEAILATWLPPTASRAAMPYAVIVAAAMVDHRLRVPHRPDASIDDNDHFIAERRPAPGLAVVH